MLKQRGYYAIELSDKTKIPLRFCTWTFTRFCEVNGDLTLEEMQKQIGVGMTLKKFISLILCAAEYVCLKEKKEFSYTEIDAADWIDEMGGLNSEGFQAMVSVIVGSFSDGQPAQQNGVEKKSAKLSQ
jgi:hypothetical protein